MTFDTADDSYIAQQLEELTELPTFPAFCRGFYRLIADYLVECGSGGSQLRGLFAHFLLLELWYHRELERMVERDQLTVGDLQSLSDKRRVSIGALVEMAARPCADPVEERARHLILAECYYHTRMTDKVVAHLERAAQSGADHPLVYFALGYNRFALALESYVRRGSSADEWLVRDYARFQAACLQAVSAFEKALTGGGEATALYGWIARILHVAGFHEAADQAQYRLRELSGDDDEHLPEQPADDDDEHLPEQPADDDDEPMAAAPISEAELERAAELLKGSFRLTDLADPPDD